MFIETRGNDGIKLQKVPFSYAILNPSASFGGLYVPVTLPKIDALSLENAASIELFRRARGTYLVKGTK